jgi:hypothetical protein
MIYSINRTTHFSLELLKNYQQGIVHSVYRKTINLAFDGQLLALQANHSPLSPISLITELDTAQMEALHVSAGNKVIVSKNKITIIGDKENYSFKHSTAAIYETRFTPEISASDIYKLKTTIRTVISNVNTNGMDLIFNNKIDANSPLPFVVAGKRIEEAKLLFIKNKYTESAAELTRIIGLGSGLTPSGDDFLCGMLAGIQVVNADAHPFTLALKDSILAHLQDTVDVSAAFLACALQNQFSLAVNNIGTLPSPEKMQESFLAIGHSSGIDTLCGIYFSLNLFE